MKKSDKEKKNKNKGLVILNIILLIILIVGGLSIYIAIDEKIITFNKDNDKITNIVKNNSNKTYNLYE